MDVSILLCPLVFFFSFLFVFHCKHCMANETAPLATWQLLMLGLSSSCLQSDTLRLAVDATGQRQWAMTFCAGVLPKLLAATCWSRGYVLGYRYILFLSWRTHFSTKPKFSQLMIKLIVCSSDDCLNSNYLHFLCQFRIVRSIMSRRSSKSQFKRQLIQLIFFLA